MALLQYDISVVGTKNVDRAFASIEQRLRAHNSTVARMMATTPGGARGASASRSSKAGVGNDNASIAAAAAIGRAKERAAREEIRLKNASNALSVRHAQKEESTRIAGIRREDRERIKSRNAINAVGLREMRNEERERRRLAVRAGRESKEHTEFVRSTVGHGLTRAAGTVGAVGRTGAAMVGVGGAGLAAAAVAGATRLDEMSRRIVVNAREAGGQSAFDPEQLRKKFTETGIAEGIAPEDIARGASEFVSKTGDINAAVERVGVLAKFSQATGSDMAELASIAASMFNNGITSTDDMAQALATLTFQGKKASFELKDMAQFMPSVMAKGAKLGMTGVEGAQSIGSLLQIAQMGTQNPAESATAVERMMDAFTSKGDKFESGEAFGGNKVQVFTDKSRTKMRSALDIIPEMMAASQGNIPQLFEALDVRGSRALDPIATKYTQTVDATKGTKEQKTAAGVAAAKAMLSNFRNVKGSYGDIQRDAGDAKKSFSVQMETVQSQLKQAVADGIMPELMKLGPELAKLVPYVSRATKVFVDIVEYFMNNPFKSLAMVVAMQLAADFAKAQIGNMVTGFIEKVFSRIRMPATSGGGSGGSGSVSIPSGSGGGGGFLSAPSGSGVMGAMGAGAALGISIGTAILTAGIVNFEKGEADMTASGKVLNTIRTMSPADLPQAKEMLAEQQKKVNEAKKGGIVGTLFGRDVAEGIGLEDPAQLKTQQAFLEEMTTLVNKLADKKLADDAAAKALQEAAASLKDASGKQGGGGGTPNRGNSPSPVKG